MTSRASKLVAAAVLASALPALARACEDEREPGDRDGDRRPPAYYAPPPEYPAPPAPAPYRWREGSWREREIAEVRDELRALDARRAEAGWRFGWNPRRMWRFEQWYAARRQELERRLYELQVVAWR